MRRVACLCFCLATLTAVSSFAASLTLEVAPREFGEFAAAGDLLLAASDQAIVLFDASSRQIHRFSESGSSWGRATKLTPQPRPDARFSRFDSRGRTLAFSGQVGISLYTDKGAPLGHLELFQPGDIAQISAREWAVSLTNLPHPGMPGSFVGRGQFGEEIPRLVVLDRDLEVTESGLFVDDPQLSGSAAVGQTLRLAWDGQRLYAAELASYRIYQLDRELDTRAIFNNPALTFEEPEGVEPSPSEDDSMANTRLALGADASQPPQGKTTAKPKGQRMTARYTPVIRDITWDEPAARLLVLVDAAALGEQPAVDLLDPASGESRRVLLKFPADTKPVTLTQIAASKRFVWLRGYPGQSPTYRFAKADFELLASEPALVPEIITADDRTTSPDGPVEN